MGLMDIFKKKSDPFDVSANPMGNSFDMGLNMQPQPMTNDPMGFDSGQSPTNNSNPYTPSVNLSTMGANSMQNGMQNNFSQQSQQSLPMDKDLQILSLKLDAIKSELDSMNQRIKNIESIAEKEQQPVQQTQQKRWY